MCTTFEDPCEPSARAASEVGKNEPVQVNASWSPSAIVPGVTTVVVSLTEGRVDVQYDENLIDLEAMRNALRGAGYDLATERARAAPRGGCCR